MQFDECFEGDYRIFVGALDAPRGEGFIAAVVVSRLVGEEALAGGEGVHPGEGNANAPRSRRAREVWRDESLYPLLVASDLARKLPLLSPDSDLAHALRVMDQEDVDALPVTPPQGSPTCGLLTRGAVRRFLFAQHAQAHAQGNYPVSPSEAAH